MNCLRIIERLLLVVGLLLIAIFGAALIDRTVSSRRELRRFRELQFSPRAEENGSLQQTAKEANLDVSLWSEKRISAYRESLTTHIDTPLGLLRIPTVRLEVPVLDGTDEFVLNRGVGHISGTVLPGRKGNIGIAGHRDGFFRVLKDVSPGTRIELETAGRLDVYEVNAIQIVSPDDVSVLQSRELPSLTLVTCYPFYFIGSAPKRYIVQAPLVDSARLEDVPALILMPGQYRSTHFRSVFQDSRLQSQKPLKEITQ
jgi:sortase A